MSWIQPSLPEFRLVLASCELKCFVICAGYGADEQDDSPTGDALYGDGQLPDVMFES